jgi:uncharacterized protein (DUF4415 family)
MGRPKENQLLKEKSMKRLKKEQRRDIAAKRDEDIDFSDIPQVLDWTLAEIGRFNRPKKQPVTMRLDADVVDWLKGYGRGYQTKANLLLRHAMLSAKQKRRSQGDNVCGTGVGTNN